MTSIKITVDRLQPGLHIRLPCKWNEHPFLFNSFKIKDEDQIRMIRHLGIKHVFINPGQSDTQPLPVQEESDKDKEEEIDQEVDLEERAKELRMMLDKGDSN